jgi:hypothetical protein
MARRPAVADVRYGARLRTASIFGKHPIGAFAQLPPGFGLASIRRWPLIYTRAVSSAQTSMLPVKVSSAGRSKTLKKVVGVEGTPSCRWAGDPQLSFSRLYLFGF